MVQVLRQSRPRARKPHTCQLCYVQIPAGDVYDRQVDLYDGHLYDWVSCRGPVGCNEVMHAISSDPECWWADEEGVDTDSAAEWAREQVRYTGSPLAAAFLTRLEIATRETQARITAARAEAAREQVAS